MNRLVRHALATVVAMILLPAVAPAAHAQVPGQRLAVAAGVVNTRVSLSPAIDRPAPVTFTRGSKCTSPRDC